MDYDKLIERLNTKLQSYALYTDSEFARAMEDAITAIETLRADLARVTAERDAAVEDIAAMASGRAAISNAPVIDAVPVVRCKDCISHGNCLTEDTFRIARIENPYCCGGKRKEANT